MAVTSCVGRRRATPAFHCSSDNLYCAWSRSLFAFDRKPWNSGFEFPNVTSGCTLGAGLGKRSYPVYMASVGLSGAGVPGVPVLAPDKLHILLLFFITILNK